MSKVRVASVQFFIRPVEFELLEEARSRGTVLPLRDSQRSRAVASELERVSLPASAS